MYKMQTVSQNMQGSGGPPTAAMYKMLTLSQNMPRIRCRQYRFCPAVLPYFQCKHAHMVDDCCLNCYLGLRGGLRSLHFKENICLCYEFANVAYAEAYGALKLLLNINSG